jgi:hypothetical protein
MWETWLDWTVDLPVHEEEELAYYRAEAARWITVGEYVGERLTAFYERHANVIAPAFESLQQSRSLSEKGFNSAAVVFAVSAVEITFTRALIEAIIVGSVAADPLVEKVLSLFRSARGLHNFEGLVFRIFEDAGVELSKHTPAGLQQPFWKTLIKINRLRNAIVHGGSPATVDEASEGVALAADLIERLFPKVVEAIGMHLHLGPQVCGSSSCTQPLWKP